MIMIPMFVLVLLLCWYLSGVLLVGCALANTCYHHGYLPRRVVVPMCMMTVLGPANFWLL